MSESVAQAQGAAPTTTNPFTGTDPNPATSPATEPAADPAPQTFDADYVANLRRENARYRTDAKANADAAKELAALKEAQKTEAEKTADRIKALEDAVQTSTIDALRSRIAAKNGIDPEDAALLLTGTDEETITAQAERLAKVKPATSPRSPDLGKGTGDGKGSDAEARQFARDFFKP
jgi:hypothetical protein